MRTIAAIIAALAVASSLAFAAEEEKLADPAQEARARALQQELRCVVCQGQSLDESDAAIAHDLRRIIREQIAAGQSDEQIKQFLVARYGEFVLLRPPVAPETLLLWFGPAVLLALGGAGVVFTIARARKRARAAPAKNPGA